MALTVIALALVVCFVLEQRRHVGGGWANEIADAAEVAMYLLVVAGVVVLAA